MLASCAAAMMAFLPPSILGDTGSNCPASIAPGPLGQWDTPEQLSDALDWEHELEHQTVEAGTGASLAHMLDPLAQELDFFPVGDLLYGGDATGPPTGSDDDDVVEAADGGDVEDAVLVGREKALDSVFGSEILRYTLEITEGSTPTLRTLVKLREKSVHRERWDFSLTAEAFDSACVSMGSNSVFKTIEDNRAQDDSRMFPLDLPVKSLTTDVMGIDVINVKLYIHWCKSGWFSGHNYGCKEGPAVGGIDVILPDEDAALL